MVFVIQQIYDTRRKNVPKSIFSVTDVSFDDLEHKKILFFIIIIMYIHMIIIEPIHFQSPAMTFCVWYCCVCGGGKQLIKMLFKCLTCMFVSVELLGWGSVSILKSLTCLHMVLLWGVNKQTCIIF